MRTTKVRQKSFSLSHQEMLPRNSEKKDLQRVEISTFPGISAIQFQFHSAVPHKISKLVECSLTFELRILHGYVGLDLNQEPCSRMMGIKLTSLPGNDGREDRFGIWDQEITWRLFAYNIFVSEMQNLGGKNEKNLIIDGVKPVILQYRASGRELCGGIYRKRLTKMPIKAFGSATSMVVELAM
ncbi:hypothetical protein VNO77_02732 [Canavalia gladiata]|uniref:Uncharacterized protein n=1 Tax=Canavalia gladiata TaxID=3824 RepID=A0AAN9RBJ5_CANGL